jgi:WD40 repeat protein
MALDFSPDGAYLCSVDMNGSVKIWNPNKGARGTELVTWQLKDGGKILRGQTIAYDPEGVYVAVGTQSGEIVLYHLLKLKPVRMVKAHKDFVAGLAFSKDGARLFSTGGDHLLKVWEFPEMKSLITAAATKEGTEILGKDLK